MKKRAVAKKMVVPEGRAYTTRVLNQEIKQLVKKLHSLAKKAVTTYAREVDEIIDSNCQEKHRIECTLDRMLDSCFDKNMLELYRKLCRYYYAIDPNATAEYVLLCRDMWDTKESDKGKVKRE